MRFISTLFVSLAAAGALAAQDAKLSVIHGIPGLPAPVEVFANGNRLFAFDFGTCKGPLSLPAARYNVEVRLNGTPVLTAPLDLQAGRDYSAIAHLTASGANTLSLFQNDISPIAAGSARVVVRHTAAAPTVDVGLDRNGSRFATIRGLSNPQSQQADVPADDYSASLFPAGGSTAVLGPARLPLAAGQVTIVYAIGSLSGGSLELLTQPIELTPKAVLEVIHGIPGLPAPAEVWVDGARLFSFNFNDRRGPFALAPRAYNIEVRLQGQTVLSANPTLQPGRLYTAIAHPRVGTGIQLSLFENPMATPAAGQARVIARHLADAPAVDIGVDQNNRRIATLTNLTNPNEVIASLPAGTYAISLFAAGTTNRVLGPVTLTLDAGLFYGIHAVGSLSGNTLGVVLQAVDLNAKTLMVMPVGRGCGGTIAASTMTPDFDRAWRITLTGAQANGMAMFIAGASDRTIGGLALPLDLSPYGARGCTLLNSAEVILPLAVNANGQAAVHVTFPRSMVRMPMAFTQFASSSNTNALGAVFTAGLAIMAQ